MGSPLGDFVRDKRDAITPAMAGLPSGGRRRSPGLRRSEVAARAGISVEYLTRIEQGRDRHPSPSVVNSIADALMLDLTEREHLYHLAKVSSGQCAVYRVPAPPARTVRPEVRELVRLLEPGVAMLTNRLGDVLVTTTGFDALFARTGLLDDQHPNLTRFVFTDARARTVFPDWEQIADERAFDLWLGPSIGNSDWVQNELAPIAGTEFTRRVDRHVRPPERPLRVDHPGGPRTVWNRETLELPKNDSQLIVVLLAADDASAAALDLLRRGDSGRALRAVSGS